MWGWGAPNGPPTALRPRGTRRGPGRSEGSAVGGGGGGGGGGGREEGGGLGDHRQVHLGAIGCLQGGAQLAQPIRQPELQTAPPGPEFAGEECRLVVLEPSGAALAHPILE